MSASDAGATPVTLSETRGRSLLRAKLRNPWGQPRFLVLGTWVYIAWACCRS